MNCMKALTRINYILSMWVLLKISWISFYEYYDSKKLFNEIKNNWLRFDKALKNKKSCWKK